jgi:hypothetical protein
VAPVPDFCNTRGVHDLRHELACMPGDAARVKIRITGAASNSPRSPSYACLASTAAGCGRRAALAARTRRRSARPRRASPHSASVQPVRRAAAQRRAPAAPPAAPQQRAELASPLQMKTRC